MVLLKQTLWPWCWLLSRVIAVPSVPKEAGTFDLAGGYSSTPSLRPAIVFSPKGPSTAFPSSPPRTKVCTVNSNGNGKDDSAFILQAINECNNGGHVVFSAENTYTIGTALNLTFLKAIDLDIQGTIIFTNDTKYWQANSFKHTFQNATSFFQLGGEDVNVFGGGTLDGNGQAWYDLYASDKYILRPILFATIGLHGGSISNLNLQYSPQWYNIVANSTSVVFDNITIRGESKNSHRATNTDGWDTYRSDNIVIQNSKINNGDDCVAFKPNSTNILVQNLDCTGSHGISVGSLGQYVDEIDIVEHVYVTNISMSDASDGARIKVWPGIASALSVDLQGGGGTGRVKNITYSNFRISNVEYAVEITQCYGQRNLNLCKQYPSSLTISDILVEGFTGKTSKKHDPVIGSLVCSSPTVCNNITVRDISVTSPSGKNSFTCGNIDKTKLSVNCSA